MNYPIYTYHVWEVGKPGSARDIEAGGPGAAIREFVPGVPIRHLWGCGSGTNNVAAFGATDGSAREFHAHIVWPKE